MGEASIKLLKVFELNPVPIEITEKYGKLRATLCEEALAIISGQKR